MEFLLYMYKTGPIGRLRRACGAYAEYSEARKAFRPGSASGSFIVMPSDGISSSKLPALQPRNRSKMKASTKMMSARLHEDYSYT